MKQRINLRSAEFTRWDNALMLYEERLRDYIDYLIECDCTEDILRKLANEVRETSVPEKFTFRFMVRTLVQIVILHLRDCTQAADRAYYALRPIRSFQSMPVQERLVYVLRDILEYSQRDTSLLIGITDAQADRLLSIARKRLDMVEGPSYLEIESPNSIYLRWRFSDCDFC
jgi:hypothetical protein